MINSNLILKTLLLIVVTFSKNCNSRNEWETENDNLNEILNYAEIQIISLDEVNVEMVEISGNNILGQNYDSNKEIYAIALTGLVANDSLIFVADIMQNSILKMNSNGNWIDIIGRRGKGPQEFSQLTNIYFNKEYYFSYDKGNQRLNMYDKEFKYLRTYYLTIQESLSNLIVSDENILVPNKIIDSKKLISMYKIESELNKINKEILPRLIPIGMEPYSYNSYLLDVNSEGNLIVAYRNLPYIFLFDDKYNHVGTLKIKSNLFSEIKNPSLKPVVANKNQVFKTISYFNKIILLDNNSIIINANSNIYLLNNEKGNYKLKSSIKFYYNNEDMGEDRFIDIREVFAFNDSWFMTSKFEPYVFRFNIN